jgi:hypothetical protein
MSNYSLPRLPRRLRFGRFRNVPISQLPDDALDLYAALLCPGPLRLALEEEVALRDGSDRSGPRLLPLEVVP